MTEPAGHLCGNWAWDPAHRELAYFERRGKAWKDQPEAVERLQTVRRVVWYRWSQAPMATSTGQVMGSQFSRVVAEYEAGGNLTVNEVDRACAGRLAEAIAGAFGLDVVRLGAPTGRRAGNLPGRDAMGRLTARVDRVESALDDAAGELTVSTRKRPFGKSTRRYRTTDIRRLELTYDVRGPLETLGVWAVAGPEEERAPLALYQGYEGWAEPREWREFAAELGRKLGVEVLTGEFPG